MAERQDAIIEAGILGVLSSKLIYLQQHPIMEQESIKEGLSRVSSLPKIVESS